MDELFTQLKDGQKVKMTEQERIAMRSRLLRMTSGLPAQSAAPQPKPSPYMSNVSTMSVMTRGLVWVLVGMIVGSTSLSFAANGTLPGDSLYPIKTAVVEKIRGALTFDPEAKAQYSATLVATRISELETLQARGTLADPNVSAIANASLATTLGEYETNLKTLSDQGRVAWAQSIAQNTVSKLAMLLPNTAATASSAQPTATLALAPQTAPVAVPQASSAEPQPTALSMSAPMIKANTALRVQATTASATAVPQPIANIPTGTPTATQTSSTTQAAIETTVSQNAVPLTSQSSAITETISSAIMNLNAISASVSTDQTIEQTPAPIQTDDNSAVSAPLEEEPTSEATASAAGNATLPVPQKPEILNANTETMQELNTSNSINPASQSD